MRGLINAEWILYKSNIPPVDFNDTLNRIPAEQITIICGKGDIFYWN